jgi:hypothetical protein
MSHMQLHPVSHYATSTGRMAGVRSKVAGTSAPAVHQLCTRCKTLPAHVKLAQQTASRGYLHAKETQRASPAAIVSCGAQLLCCQAQPEIRQGSRGTKPRPEPASCSAVQATALQMPPSRRIQEQSAARTAGGDAPSRKLGPSDGGSAHSRASARGGVTSGAEGMMGLWIAQQGMSVHRRPAAPLFQSVK